MKVTAITKGYYNGKVMQAGEEFPLNDAADLGSWMGGADAEKLRAKQAKGGKTSAADTKATKDAAAAAAKALKDAEGVKANAEKEAEDAVAAAKAEAAQIVADAQKAAQEAAKTAGGNAGQ